MKTLTDIVPEDVARQLYEAGYVVIRRPSADPFEPPPGTIPKDRVYQWMHMERDKVLFDPHGDKTYPLGWAPVEHDRHPSIYGPIGFVGHITKHGLGLFEKPRFEVEREQQSYIDKARKQSDDFFEGKGFTGGARIVEESGGGGQPHKVVERKGPRIEPRETADTPVAERSTTQSRIPQDMRPHLQRLMQLRDETYGHLVGDREVGDDEKVLLKDRALSAAIERVRAEIRNPKKEKSDGTPSGR